MKHTFWMAAAFLGAVACGHTKEVESGAEAKPESRPASSPSSTRSAKPARRGGDDVPLASDPMSMLTPKGQQALRDQLKRRDLLKEEGSVPAALRKFQSAEGIPETGMPDDETLKRLGLDPDEVVVRVRPET